MVRFDAMPPPPRARGAREAGGLAGGLLAGRQANITNAGALATMEKTTVRIHGLMELIEFLNSVKDPGAWEPVHTEKDEP
jgi:hypothetical protein